MSREPSRSDTLSLSTDYCDEVARVRRCCDERVYDADADAETERGLSARSESSVSVA